jgi:exodeoxyribonuclease III
MKIIAWNINGIRAMLKKKDLINLINKEDPDIFCLGETKISCPFEDTKEEIKKLLNKSYNDYWSPCKVKNGYSGTAIFTKKKPKNIIYGLNIDDKEYDEEGRVITCEFSKFILVHVYTPNSGEALARLDYRTKSWDKIFTKYLKKLSENKNVILCGDLNVAHNEIDLKNPKTNLRSAGFTIEERQSFNHLIKDTNMIDTFRFLHPDEIKYSYWSYRMKARERNSGWRIDYFIVSEKIIKKIIKSDILIDIYGSDHAPVILEIDIK